MRFRPLLALTAACTVLAACDGLKEALTAHVDVVARAGSQELSVTRLGDLLGNAKLPVPVTRDNAAILADIWTGYEQMGYAAAHGDSLNDKHAIDAAVAPMLNMQRLQKMMDSIQQSFKVDSGGEAQYNQGAGGLLAARHILIGFKNPEVPASQAEKDSLKKKAIAVRAQVTAANFADMAKKYSSDPTAKQNAGSLGVFERGAMIAEFSNATAALKPGEISQPVETHYGYHIIQRLPYADAKAQFDSQYSQAARGVADSTYLAQLQNNANIVVKDNAPALIKAAAKEPAKHHSDHAVVATFKGGSLDVGQLLGWVEATPPQQQVMQHIPQAPDSTLKPFVKSVATQEVLLHRADSLKVQVSDQDKAQMYSSFGQLVGNIWTSLGVDPKQLSDSAKNVPEKERLAASRVDSFLDKMMAGQAQPMSVPLPLKKMLDAKYESSVNAAGIDRAFERAQKVRAAADSARAASQPKSQIPIPGAGAAPPQGAPAPAPQPSQPGKPAPSPKKP